jgi:ABC-type Fe3+/spermidine/putrescine transport system ATPase subunit
VTHDQEEALAMSDRVIVMNHGVVEQAGYARGCLPLARRRVRRAASSGNRTFLPAAIAGRDGSHVRIALEDGPTLLAPAKSATDGQKVTAVVRAQRLAVESGQRSRGRRTYCRQDRGHLLSRRHGRLSGRGRPQPHPGDRHGGDRILKEGDPISLTVRPEDVVLLDEAGRRIPAA